MNAQLKRTAIDKILDCSGVEAGKEDHGAEDDEQQESKPNPANDFTRPVNFIPQIGLKSGLLLDFGLERGDIDAEELEPVKELETGVQEGPVHNALDLVQEGDGSEEEHEEVPGLEENWYLGVFLLTMKELIFLNFLYPYLTWRPLKKK